MKITRAEKIDAPTHQRSEIFQIPSGTGKTIEWSIGIDSDKLEFLVKEVSSP